MRPRTEVIWLNLPALQDWYTLRTAIGISGEIKKEVLKYVTKKGFEYVLSANIVYSPEEIC